MTRPASINTDDAPGSTRPPSDIGVAVESILAAHTVKRALIVGPVVVTAAFLIRGLGGATAAMIGVGVVVVNFLLAGAVLSRAARVSLAAYQAAALFGFLTRLGLIAGTMLAVAQVMDLDRLSFGMAAIGTYMVLLILEAVALTRGRERDLDWTS